MVKGPSLYNKIRNFLLVLQFCLSHSIIILLFCKSRIISDYTMLNLYKEKLKVFYSQRKKYIIGQSNIRSYTILQWYTQKCRIYIFIFYNNN